jgi:hypothetical protein
MGFEKKTKNRSSLCKAVNVLGLENGKQNNDIIPKEETKTRRLVDRQPATQNTHASFSDGTCREDPHARIRNAAGSLFHKTMWLIMGS